MHGQSPGISRSPSTPCFAQAAVPKETSSAQTIRRKRYDSQMHSVADHYRSHLAPVYVWMSGGFDAAMARGETEIGALLPDLSSGSCAVDLGAAFGMHSIPLARRGCSVLALDSSSYLLEQLKAYAQTLAITA